MRLKVFLELVLKMLVSFSMNGLKKRTLYMLEYLINYFRNNLVITKDSIESEILYAFNTQFQQLKRLITESSFKIEIKTIHLIIQIVSSEVIPFKGEPLKGIQLMGILESRTLDFKNVILLSVNEGLFPKGKSNNSFYSL